MDWKKKHHPHRRQKTNNKSALDHAGSHRDRETRGPTGALPHGTAFWRASGSSDTSVKLCTYTGFRCTCTLFVHTWVALYSCLIIFNYVLFLLLPKQKNQSQILCLTCTNMANKVDSDSKRRTPICDTLKKVKEVHRNTPCKNSDLNNTGLKNIK